MDDALEVRPATKADRSALLVFHIALYVEHRGRITPPELEPFFAHRSFGTVLRDDVDAMLHDRDTIVLVAARGGAPVGYISGSISTDTRRVLARKGTIGDWYVDEAERGRGAGRALVDELERRFVEAGCEVVESATWAFNDGARRAHEALGFREIQIVYRKRIPKL